MQILWQTFLFQDHFPQEYVVNPGAEPDAGLARWLQ